MPVDAKRVQRVFLAAVEAADPAARTALLDRECGPDPEQRQRVEALLKAHDKPGRFLNGPAVAEGGIGACALVLDEATPAGEEGGTGAYTPAPGAAAPVTVAAPRPRTEAPGTRIGPYKLLQVIGEGGMGAVWMAEQQAPVRRMVALKVIKAGMDSAQVVARFEAERQTLALMDHPHIARVFDGGTTEQGRPYFVMELVKGTHITQYCDEHRLTIPRRLELFVQVCQALQHAHQKGIIHRDIKPSNVLVAPSDGQPVVKVIDFGVAKATGPRLAERTLITELGAVVGTVEYMSPEQAELNNQDIDTRSDIYAAGVLLYELLTETTPFTRQRLKNAAFTEMLRIIREEEPPKPSMRLGESKESLPSISARRHMEPAKLTKSLRGELDCIVMKALEKDRNRRYETAAALARDIQRYLADEPVEAQPPSVRYRLGKFVRRNKGPVLAASLVALALLAGIVGTTRGLVEAKRQKQLAVAEAKAAALARQKAERNLEIATSSVNRFLGCVGEDPRLKEKDFFALRKKLLGSAVPFFEYFAAAKADNYWEESGRGMAYLRLASLRYYMGEKEAALAAYEEARAVFEKLVADFPTDFGYRAQLAASCRNVGCVLKELGKHPQAETAFRQALAVGEKLAADFPRAHRARKELGNYYNNLGTLLHEQGRHPEAETAFRQALAIQEKLAADSPTVSIYAIDLGESYVNLGRLVRDRGEPAAALEWLAKAIVRLQAALKQEPGLATARLSLRNAHRERAKALGQLGRHAEATAAVEALLEPGQADAGTLYDAASVYSLAAGVAKGDQARAEKYAARAVAMLREAVQKGHDNVAQLKKGADFDPLRQREDFQAVLAELEKASATRMPK